MQQLEVSAGDVAQNSKPPAHHPVATRETTQDCNMRGTLFLFDLLTALALERSTDCTDIISYDPRVTTSTCDESCLKGDILSDYCRFDPVDIVNDEFVFDLDGCYSPYVQGFFDINEAPSGIFPFNATTRQHCGKVCQVLFDCESWFWTMEPINGHTCFYREPGSYARLLENHLEDPNATLNELCPPEIAEGCRNGTLDCEECRGHLRCIWKSKKVLSAKDWCTLQKEDCSTTTTVLPSTTTESIVTAKKATLLTNAVRNKTGDMPLAFGVAGGAVAIGGIAMLVRKIVMSNNPQLDEDRPDQIYDEQVHNVNAEDYL